MINKEVKNERKPANIARLGDDVTVRYEYVENNKCWY